MTARQKVVVENNPPPVLHFLKFSKSRKVNMSSKVMVIISTAEKDKALTGILYAKNA
jgi:hypothetical protein